MKRLRNNRLLGPSFPIFSADFLPWQKTGSPSPDRFQRRGACCAPMGFSSNCLSHYEYHHEPACERCNCRDVHRPDDLEREHRNKDRQHGKDHHPDRHRCHTHHNRCNQHGNIQQVPNIAELGDGQAIVHFTEHLKAAMVKA